MTDSVKQTLDTRLQHAGLADFNPVTGSAPVALPPMRTSTVRFRDLSALDNALAARADGQRAVVYGRGGMDTHDALERVFCDLEGAQRTFLAPSGMAAITLAMLATLSAGDHVLVADCAYAPVRTLDNSMLQRLNIQVSYCPGHVNGLAQHLKPNTRVLYVESPGSLLFEMLDMPALSTFAKQHNLLLVTDNTWGAGYIYRPLDLGADVSVVAGTKYVGGHSDLMLGAVMVNDPDLIQRMHQTHYAMGLSVSADDVWLALRGVRTMPIRLRQSAENALQVCEFLSGRPEVARIYHPAWPDDAGHALWLRDCTGSNGMLAVQLKLNSDQARRLVEALTLFGIGFSWGGFESLVQLVQNSMLASHSYWQGGNDTVLRLHIGLESPVDLIADLTQALDSCNS